mgnify:CR=1 FL=1
MNISLYLKYQKSFFYAKYYDVHDEIRETSNYLSKLFSRYNLTDSAYKYQDIYITIQDSLFNSDKIRSLQIATIQENIKQEKIREKIQKEHEERNNNLILAAIGFFIPQMRQTSADPWTNGLGFLSVSSYRIKLI